MDRKKLPVLELLDYPDIVAADGDRDRDDALVELDRDLFLCRVDALDDCFFALEGPGNEFDNCPLVDTGNHRFRDEEVTDFGKARLALNDGTGMRDFLYELLDAVQLLRGLDEDIPLQLVWAR